MSHRRTAALLAAVAVGWAVARPARSPRPPEPAGAARLTEVRVLGNGLTVVAVQEPFAAPTATLALRTGDWDAGVAAPEGWRVDRDSSRVTAGLPSPEAARAWLAERWREAQAGLPGGALAPSIGLVVVVGPERPEDALARVASATTNWSGPPIADDDRSGPPPRRARDSSLAFDLDGRLGVRERAAAELLREALRAPGPEPVELRVLPRVDGDWVELDPEGSCRDAACEARLRERVVRAPGDADLADLRARARVARERALEEPADRAEATVTEWLAGREPERVEAITAALAEVGPDELQAVASRVGRARRGVRLGAALPRAVRPAPPPLALEVSEDGRVVAGWDGLAGTFRGVLRVAGGWRDAPAACEALRALDRRRPGPAGARWTLRRCDPGEVLVSLDGPAEVGLPTLRALVDALRAGDAPVAELGLSNSEAHDVAVEWAISRAAPPPLDHPAAPEELRSALAALGRLPLSLAWFGAEAPDRLAAALPAPVAAREPPPVAAPYEPNVRVRHDRRLLVGARFGPVVHPGSAESAVVFLEALRPRLAGTGISARLELRPGEPAVLVARGPAKKDAAASLAAFLSADWTGALTPAVADRRDQPAAWLPALAVGGRPRATSAAELDAIANAWLAGSATVLDGVGDRDLPGFVTVELDRHRR